MSKKSSLFFEGQRDRDCSIHSLNNAIGKRVVTKDDVIRYVDDQGARYAADNGLKVTDSRVAKFKNKLASGSTFFTAETVWETAKRLGKIGGWVPVPGFGGAFSSVAGLPSYIRDSSSMVILGVDGGEEYETKQQPKEGAKGEGLTTTKKKKQPIQSVGDKWRKAIVGRMRLGNNNHAIAVRDGKIYDSQMVERGPRPFNDEQLRKSLSRVFVAYLIQKAGDTRPHYLIRTKPSSMPPSVYDS